MTPASFEQLSMPFGISGLLPSKDKDAWFTPPDILVLARAVMGGIDLDPASCAAANEVVQAVRYFSIAEDGLRQPWSGRVWLNPPYSNPALWTRKLLSEYQSGYVSEAILLVPPDTDTQWFQPLFRFPICFKHGRIKFWGRKGKSNVQGSCFVYFGSNIKRFAAVFGEIGAVMLRILSQSIEEDVCLKRFKSP